MSFPSPLTAANVGRRGAHDAGSQGAGPTVLDTKARAKEGGRSGGVAFMECSRGSAAETAAERRNLTHSTIRVSLTFLNLMSSKLRSTQERRTSKWCHHTAHWQSIEQRRPGSSTGSITIAIASRFSASSHRVTGTSVFHYLSPAV